MNKTIEDLVCVVDGVKTINFVLLEEQYGSELAKQLKADFDYVQERKQEWKLDVIDESKHFVLFAFTTWSCSQVYEIQKSSKIIVDQYLVGYSKCEKLIGLMNSLRPETVVNK